MRLRGAANEKFMARSSNDDEKSRASSRLPVLSINLEKRLIILYHALTELKV